MKTETEKVYKQGRKWAFASVAALSVGLGATGTNVRAHTTNPNKNDTKSSHDDNEIDSSVTILGATTEDDITTVSNLSVNPLQNETTISGATNEFETYSNVAQEINIESKPATKTEQINEIKAPETKSSKPIFSTNISAQTFIENLQTSATAAWNKDGLLPSITVAQAIIESNWGQSELATQAHNLFAIKGSHFGNSVNHPSREYINGAYITVYDLFKSYDNNSQSITDHTKSLAENPQYANLVKDDNYTSVATKLQTAGYSDDTNYAATIISVIEKYHLEQLDTIAVNDSNSLKLTKASNEEDSAIKNIPAESSNHSEYYTVQINDTLASIANKFETTTDILASKNNIDKFNTVYIGQTLLVPAISNSTKYEISDAIA